MPDYLRAAFIDLHPASAPPPLRATLPEAHATLASRNHTLATFDASLRAFAEADRAFRADALLLDAFRYRWLVRARGGVVSRTIVHERPEGALAQPIELPLDAAAVVRVARDLAEITALLAAQPDAPAPEGDEIELPLDYRDEPSMRALLDRVAGALRGGEQHAFVAEVELDRFLVELSPGRAVVRRLVAVTEGPLVARLLKREFEPLPAPPPRPGEKREQPLYWPEDMLAALTAQAARLDVSMSWVAQRAWHLSRESIAGRAREELAALLRGHSQGKRKQTLFFPGEMLLEIERETRRLDSSHSFVVQAAWVLARETIGALEPRSGE